MAVSQVTFEVGDQHLLADVRNPKIPFTKGVFIYAHRLVEGTDYDAADQVEITFEGAQRVLYADVKENDGTNYSSIDYTIDSVSSGVGKKLTTATTGAASEEILVYAIVEV